jgi:transcriptional regulator with XRE-family HTH domain
MALAASDVRGIVDRICARPDVVDAFRRRDLGTVIEILGSHGLTQGRLAGLTGISQGRLSEYKKHRRAPQASSTFEAFADGLGLPPDARKALGLAAGDSAGDPGRASANVPADVGSAYPRTPEQAVGDVSGLWRADLSEAPFLQAPLDAAVWNDAALRWLADPGRRPDRGAPGMARVGVSDIERFRVTVELFRQLDDRFGGGHARQALVQYLSLDGTRLLHGRYGGDVGRELFSAVAEATLLTAWMSYDSAPGSAVAQRYFVQALALAQTGEDRLLGASVLDAMSHQATYMGRFSEAAGLAQAARAGTRGIATATLNSHFHVMEARALARLGDAQGCDRALTEAEREFGRRQPDNDPAWIHYFDEAELAAEFGHCFRDLGRPVDAAQQAGRSLAAVSDTVFMRSDFFAMMVLADAHLAAGELELACRSALTALAAGEQIRSARCVGYLRDFRDRLASAGNARAAADFGDQARASRLWRIAARPARDAA